MSTDTTCGKAKGYPGEYCSWGVPRPMYILSKIQTKSLTITLELTLSMIVKAKGVYSL